MRTDDYLADYARLGLQPGCSAEALERVWRLAVSELHPDRASDGLDSASRSRQLHEVTVAYRRLRSFEREHGRLPGGAVVHQQPPAPAQPSGLSSVPTEKSPVSGRRTRVGLAILGALALAVLFAWSALHVPVRQEPWLAEESVLLKPPAPGLADVVPVTETRREQRIRVGSTEAQVERLVGAPLVSEADVWEYGPSHVRFERGRVVGWYSSPLKPLPVDVETR